MAVAAQQAVHFVGMPEGFFPLAHATLYLATAPKSNSVGTAFGAAMADVKETRNDPVPLHLRNAPTRLMRELGYGEGYHYAHDDYDVEQLNLPENLRGRRYYEPSGRTDDRAREQKKGGPSDSRTASFPLLLLGVCVGASHNQIIERHTCERPVNSERIYLDNAATTPLRREVADAMREALADSGFNPSSLHAEGRRARARARRRARSRCRVARRHAQRDHLYRRAEPRQTIRRF